MKSLKYISLAVIVAIVGFSSCKKYEDGPAFSLKSKKARVANTWEIDVAYRNGEVVTDDYDEFTLRTEVDGNASLAALYSLGDFSFEYETQGTWQFEDSKEVISFDYENDDADAKYQILKLENDNMWLREQGGEDELHLKSK
jgi:hypothetical protein